MLKKILFLSIFIPLINLYSQNLEDKFKYKTTYGLTYSLDSTQTNKPKTEDMILFLGEKVSVFSSRSKTMGNEPVVIGNSGQTPRMAVTDFQYIIIKDQKRKSLYYTLQIKDDFFYYEQANNIFDWELTGETKILEGYTVQKAITSFSGRNYIAWFTTEIPISDGPYKFNGLPGLILELADTQNHYHFLLKAFEKLTPPVSFKTNLKHYINTDKETLLETQLRYRRDPFSYQKNPNITISPEVHKKYVESFAELLEKENNPIERE